jgi:N6-adenosine-specific RNA methylase IME4
MNPHPLASLFPLMTGPDFEGLCADIARQGLLEPIVTHEGKVLDGRNRLRACIETGMPPVFREWDGPDPLAFVLSANLHRRHLNESQRAMVAARVATLPRGANQHTEISACSQGRASELFNVSPDSIQFARKVLDRGTPELIAACDLPACDQGAVKVSQAAQLADDDPAYQLAILAKVGAGLPVTEAKRQLKRETLRTAPFPEGKYRVLYPDPPWLYGNDLARCMAGSTSAADHYAQMSIAELCAFEVNGRHVSDLAMDDAVMFMWVPAPLLYEAAPVLKAWGFTYKQLIVWDKVGHMVRHYVSSRCELLLICTRGSCLPDGGTLLDNVVPVVSIEKSRVHSRKPERFYEIIEEMYPPGPRIELFARGKVPEDWDAWGNEVEDD